jgi:hypothetical protein
MYETLNRSAGTAAAGRPAGRAVGDPLTHDQDAGTAGRK